MVSIGVTGGIGAGKSTVLSYVKSHYPCEIYRADDVAHQVMQLGQPCYDELILLLGSGVVSPTKEIDRIKLAARIFMDKNLLGRVNAVVHPAVQDYLTKCIQQAKELDEPDFIFIEASLLIETGYSDKVDELWYVHADEDIRTQRLERERGYSRDRITQTMKNQLSEEAFRRNCQVVLENNTTPEALYRQVDDRLLTLKRSM
jgi:dephospho-CoA kinase